MERVKEYHEVQSEAPVIKPNDPGQYWLKDGSIKFQNFSIRYRKTIKLYEMKLLNMTEKDDI